MEISWFKTTRTDFRQPKIVGKQKTWLSALKKNQNRSRVERKGGWEAKNVRHPRQERTRTDFG